MDGAAITGDGVLAATVGIGQGRELVVGAEGTDADDGGGRVWCWREGEAIGVEAD